MAELLDIEVNALTKTYGDFTAVDHISFEVPRGTIVGFLGPNGAGKTTTIRMLTCSMPPTSGSAKVAGHDVFFDSLEVRKNIGYLPESAPLYTDMRVGEYLTYRGRLRGMKRDLIKKRVAEVAEKCWLTDRLKSIIGTLSKGYRQRVGIADALLHSPPVLVLDEPTVGLDPSQIVETRKLFADLARQHTVLLSSHILGEVEKLCQRVIIIARGKIVAQGTPEELKAKAATGLAVEVRGPADQVKSALAALPGVTAVDLLQNGPAARFSVKGKVDGAGRELISNAVAARGWALRELRPEGASLEEYFLQITDPAGNLAATAAA